MRNLSLALFFVLIGIAFIAIYMTNGASRAMRSSNSASTEQIQQSVSIFNSFSTPKKSARYGSNTPAHSSVLAGAPINVVIDFNFDLAPNSTISIIKDGKEYGINDVVIDENDLSMRRDFDSNAPDGIYTVIYNACWPDGSCHDGEFQFAVDRTKISEYEDLRGQDEVTINLSSLKFNPRNILISKGTEVVWKNDDAVEHYINTDAHPSHTYYPSQNSEALKKNDIYPLVFDKSGAYPYHCSAHESVMTGSILVE